MSEQPRNPETEITDPMSIAEARIQKALKTHATTLDLATLGLTKLPKSIAQLSELRDLFLEQNNLSTLPEYIAQLSQLQALSVGYNKLTTLPESVTKFPDLEWLSLSGNQLTTLPESVIRLSNLRTLYLDNNNLSTLPEHIAQLSQLRKLALDHNQMTTLPKALRKLKLLEELYLHGNEALGLPVEVLGPTYYESSSLARAKATAILDYYFRARGDEKRPLNEAKLILVGRGAVGKTSIANRLIHGTFEDVKKTEGIRITEWPLTVGKDRDEVRLNVWDFGGQEIMHATHQFFLTERSLYLLVLSGREGVEDTDAEYWLKLIQSFGGDSPVVIVLNKIKEHPFDVNRNALLRKYPFIRDFIKTDCEDATGIEKLRGIVERETDGLEHLRDAFPASWFSIKENLAGMDKNYLSFDEYRKECAKLGEEDPQAQDSLAFYLHSLGIALNYKDDPRLKDTHVLNPHWVTSGIYKILNANRLETQKGEISLKDLSAVLDVQDYPEEMHGFLLELMKKFELCFSFADDEERYLIPELLDKQEPTMAQEFKPEECLNFQYHYPVLPEGLLPRFIVRTHILGDEKSLWRTGVILEFEGSRALVKADVQDKRVFVNVKGPAESRRRLLGLIRTDFEQIHRGIRNLNPLEMVPLPEQPDVVVPYEELAVMERQGVLSLPKVVDGRVTQLDVRTLLNGVDLEGARRVERAVDELRRASRVFISYSHRDERLRNRLEVHLKLLQREGLIDIWHDREIEAGEDWKQKIDENLERADIILLLVSPDFLASDYCYEIEMRKALEMHEAKGARVIPIIVRDVNWKIAPLAKLNALPKDGKAVTAWANRDTAWKNVSEGIQKVAEMVRNKNARA